MTLAEVLRQPAVKAYSRKGRHPMAILFGLWCLTPGEGMKWLADRGGIISDLWERAPAPDEITWGEVIAAFEAAKAAVNPAWCDWCISSIKSKILEKSS